ncbi:hypothetical protein AZ66_24560 [Paenibacillus sp. E194]|jgi:Protein of unknown function (DUF4446)|uniref:DUF4446 family protein n=4 Tax=Paenibacillus TaxID=44249 RepID=A0A383RIU8_PAEAL|nr:MULTISPECIES: DUF4446 family protein [Paenibacillus]EPY08541.1 hypothetical protein PAALTS15_04281 [Paenibacillus alvei TS-15]KJB85449.1 hypothetical protein AZ66_24560 [Paenibacillus sp. E194]MCM3288999.1 DUF4446 family protein [Paenibacillus sp. MER 180]MCY9529062.1 DUF4446 family protein [Paenibacillus alvei]MDT8978756.1 DUF4446 family protein [Paenibacillus sp. chi10]
MMNELQNDWLPLIAAGIGILLLLLLIIVLLQGSQLRKLRRKYEAIMGESGIENLDVVLSSMHEDIAHLQGKTEQHHADMEQTKKALKKMKSHVGIQRYNAFAERGSDLSFSIAWLNEEQDGVVITGIHGRDHSYVYAKPIENGQSSYSLSPEEKQAMELAEAKKGS